MTYKSFVTLDELFDLLVQRFNIEPPGALTPTELGDWAKLKQHVIQVRYVVSTHFRPVMTYPESIV